MSRVTPSSLRGIGRILWALGAIGVGIGWLALPAGGTHAPTETGTGTGGIATDWLRQASTAPGASRAFTIACVGDVMLGRGVAQALDGQWTQAFAALAPRLTGADLAFANLESPLAAGTATTASPAYDLHAPPDALAALRAGGFDLVSLANNHALDGGTTGLAQTRAVLQAGGIVGVGERGTGVPGYPARFIAFDDSGPPLDVTVAEETVRAAARTGDFVVVSLHWGGEYQAAPGPRQRMVAHRLSQAGANLIVGHGPHVLQPMEWVGKTLVAYSLGNFLFDQPYPVDCRWGAILWVAVRRGHIAAVWVTPTVAGQGRVTLADPETAAIIRYRLGIASRP